MNVRAAAAALGGDVVGRDAVLCPGPNHSPADRSLSVRFYGDNFVCHSHADDCWQACRDHVKARLGNADDDRGSDRPTVAKAATCDKDAISRALELWRETKPLRGSPGEIHLARRGVRYDGDALRWHPSCPFGKDRVGSMVGLVRNIVTNELQAIHRTAIGPTGEKLSHLGNNGGLSFGPTGGGAIKLSQDANVERVIAIGEASKPRCRSGACLTLNRCRCGVC